MIISSTKYLTSFSKKRNGQNLNKLKKRMKALELPSKLIFSIQNSAIDT